ncbi:MAG TPA: cell division protein ZapA [Sediminispirochaeta sp.]|nr:cell division protein ZapA [Sediminispirochaeta sp.]
MGVESEPVRFFLLGTSFTIKTNEDPHYLYRIVQKVEKRFEQVRKNMGVSDPLRIAVLSSIILTDELQKLHSESEEAETLTRNLIDLIDRTLD